MFSLDDFRYGCPPRIMGSETELTVSFKGDESVDFEEWMDRQYKTVGYYFSDDTLRLNNGGIVYLDGGLVESSTPECIGGSEVTRYERAGERIVQHLIDNEAADIFTSRKAYKRSGYYPVFSKGGEQLLDAHQVGNHENYFTMQADPYNPYALGDFLATRPIWSGAGIVGPGGYSCYQRLPVFDSVCRNLYLDDADPDDHRLEFKDGDGNMSDWAVKTKFNMTSLVIRLCEHNLYPNEYKLVSSERQTILAIGQNYGEQIGLIKAGSVVSATDHQRMIARLALDKLGNDPDLPSEEIAAAQSVIETCDAIDTFLRDPEALSLISDRVEWAAKLAWMLSHSLKSKDIKTSCLYAVQKDLEWGDISRDSPSLKWFREHSTHMVGNKQIVKAQKQPPKNRADLRTRSAKSALKTDYILSDRFWSTIDTPEGDYVANDPYAIE